MIKKYKDTLKKHFEEVLSIKTHPREIAAGFAIGTFFANFPTFGIEFLILFFILAIFKKVSKIAIIFAYIVWNPLISYPLSVLGYVLGDMILGDAPRILLRFEVFQGIIQFTLRYLLGTLIIASLLSFASYFVVYYVARKYQENFSSSNTYSSSSK